MPTHLVAEEGARNVDELTSDDGDLLAGKDLLGDNRSETAEEVALAVDEVRLALLERHL